ncbi:unnamed protein product [Mucor hiemalis]
MKAKLELILPENPIYFCGESQLEKQKLKGILRVIAAKSFTLTKIEIIYKVKTHLNWKDESHGALFSSRMTASKTLRKSAQTLLQGFTITPGIVDLEFEIIVPSYLCPSFKSEYCQISHTVAAKMITPSKFLLSRINKKQISIEKSIQVRKTCLSKEVLMNIVPVPHLVMTGERPNVIKWVFQTPLSAHMEEASEFKGVFKSANNETITLNKIEIDVMQEELYYYDVSCTEIKRKLVTVNNRPSIYIEPPLDTIIPFSFQLGSRKDDDNFIKGKLSPSLNSPFLKIRHFIRLVLHVNNRNPISICIGLPIQVTPQIDEEFQQVDVSRDDLLPPSYEFVTQQGDTLPKYKRRHHRRRHQNQDNVNYNEIFSTTPNLVEVGDHIDQLQQIAIGKNNNDDYNFSFLSNENVINIGERSINEFYAIQ